MLAIEYLVHDDVTIKMAMGNKTLPPFWYVKKPIYEDDPHPKYSKEQIIRLINEDYDVWYWSDGWEPVTPRQFATVEEALLAYETWRASEGKS